MGTSRTRRGKARPKPKGNAVERASRRVNASAADLVVETAKVIERPPADASVLGHQPHFLRRLERLSDDARELALRFYHDAALARFVARIACGRDPEAVLAADGEEPEDPESERVVLDLEPALDPGKIVVDIKGKVVTCLAPGMPQGLHRRFGFAQVSAALRVAEASRRFQQAVQREAPKIDFSALSLRIEEAGWLTPREDLRQLRVLDSAASAYLAQMHKNALVRHAEAWGAATETAGAGHDKTLRAWFKASGALAVYTVLLAEIGAPPRLRVLRAGLSLHEPIGAMILGACATRWHRLDAEDDLFDPKLKPDDVGSKIDLFPIHFGLITYYGLLQRMVPRSPRSAGLYTRIDEFMRTFFDYYDAEYQEVHRLGLPLDPAVTLMRDLSLLARGQKPDWGDDLVDDPDTLPPLRLCDHCLPDGQASPRLIRNLAQRLFACSHRSLITIFNTREELDRWTRRLGPLDQGRSGFFAPPFFQELAVPKRAATGRNEPCPCGSGKKYKKCCMRRANAS